MNSRNKNDPRKKTIPNARINVPAIVVGKSIKIILAKRITNESGPEQNNKNNTFKGPPPEESPSSLILFK